MIMIIITMFIIIIKIVMTAETGGQIIGFTI